VTPNDNQAPPPPRDPIALAKLIGDIATGQVADRMPDAPEGAQECGAKGELRIERILGTAGDARRFQLAQVLLQRGEPPESLRVIGRPGRLPTPAEREARAAGVQGVR